ncbi:glycosyltransferase family 25 protein [Rhizobium grahamii]|uniref:Glycosyl transferase n=1 Tax=Rhizobium grahamii TaxID=1120045 RepID=A0A370KEJ6_9HYPH|nr:glycosyltransferase family 25 protein [Rhizobium grahamii]RDJ02327.1 glycosyl transferase [Rhizobium grahamii]
MHTIPLREAIQAKRPPVQFATFLINLDRSTDRGTRMAFLLGHMGLGFERVSAIDGAKLRRPFPYFDERGYLLRHGRKPNPYEIGCYLSHVECARRLLASADEYALILEDDLNFDARFMTLVTEVLAINSQWDIVRLSTVNVGRKYQVSRLTPKHSFAISLTREKGSGAYLINRRAAEWITQRLVPMRLPYDLAFDTEYLVGLRAFFVDPPPVWQDAEPKSLIQRRVSDYKLGWRRPPTVIPYRAVIEILRFLGRSARLLSRRLMG